MAARHRSAALCASSLNEYGARGVDFAFGMDNRLQLLICMIARGASKAILDGEIGHSFEYSNRFKVNF